MVPIIEEQLLTVGENHDGWRLDQFIVALFPEHSRSFIQRLIGDENIVIDGEPAKKSRSVRCGEKVCIKWPEDVPFVPAREQITFPIIYEDDDIIVINKPPFMPVHPGTGRPNGTLVNALLGYDFNSFANMTTCEAHRPGIVHRLDMDTSGAMVVAKNDYTRTAMSQRFRMREVDKIYLALCTAIPEEKEQIICLPIGRHRLNRHKMAVDDRGKYALTRFQVIAEGDNAALLKVSIETGRTHQIRVHLAKIRHPIIGDPMYGSRTREPFRMPRQMLHAWRLAFSHPRTNEPLSFTATPLDDFREATEKAGIDLDDALGAPGQ